MRPGDGDLKDYLRPLTVSESQLGPPFHAQLSPVPLPGLFGALHAASGQGASRQYFSIIRREVHVQAFVAIPRTMLAPKAAMMKA